MANLVKVFSSNGVATSVADEELVVKNENNQNAFAWKQLSIMAKQDCEIVINEGTSIESRVMLIPNLAFQLETLTIKSLKFTESGIEYYYNAGY